MAVEPTPDGVEHRVGEDVDVGIDDGRQAGGDGVPFRIVQGRQ